MVLSSPAIPQARRPIGLRSHAPLLAVECVVLGCGIVFIDQYLFYPESHCVLNYVGDERGAILCRLGWLAGPPLLLFVLAVVTYLGFRALEKHLGSLLEVLRAGGALRELRRGRGSLLEEAHHRLAAPYRSPEAARCTAGALCEFAQSGRVTPSEASSALTLARTLCPHGAPWSCPAPVDFSGAGAQAVVELLGSQVALPVRGNDPLCCTANGARGALQRKNWRSLWSSVVPRVLGGMAFVVGASLLWFVRDVFVVVGQALWGVVASSELGVVDAFALGWSVVAMVLVGGLELERVFEK